jgi:hypothetical protein
MELHHKLMALFPEIIALLYNYHLIMKFIDIDRSNSEALNPQIMVIMFWVYNKLKYACHCDIRYVKT